MANQDWTRFVKRITIKADSQAIYKAFSTPSGFEKWFLRKAIFTATNGDKRVDNEAIQPSDTYEFFWYGHPDTTTEKSHIIETNGKDYVKFGFSDDTTVAIRIKQEDGENVVELTQENIKPTDNPLNSLYVWCGEGWTFYLANLKSILEGGIDLRNKNEKIKSVVNS